jgi:bifunctional non-homologous end joining protein LigD
VVDGAEPAPFPGFIKPQLATLRDIVPSGADWLHEIKFDG